MRSRERHGMHRSAEYRIWCHIKSRCKNKRDKFYADYGGRGISVCEQWDSSFAAFYADIGPRPSSLHQIDRFPNNDGNYEPGNCRWATLEQQQRNTRKNRLYSDGESLKCLAEWASKYGIKSGSRDYKRIWYRVRVSGMSIDEAINTKVSVNIFCVQGITGTVTELCRHFGVRAEIARNRIHRGWSVEKSVTYPVSRA